MTAHLHPFRQTGIQLSSLNKKKSYSVHCLQSGLQEQGSKCFSTLLNPVCSHTGFLQVYLSPQGAEISGCRC